MLEDVPNTHDSKRHQRASLRQALVAETIVEPWLLGWRWDVICSHSKRSCSAGCRPVARPGARCWDGGANRWLDSLCRGSGAPVFPRDLDLIRVADPRPAAVVVDCWLDTVPPTCWCATRSGPPGAAPVEGCRHRHRRRGAAALPHQPSRLSQRPRPLRRDRRASQEGPHDPSPPM